MTAYCTILAGALAGALIAPVAFAADAPAPPRMTWSFAGPFGMYDQGQLQRGFKIYREACAGCHSLELVAIGALMSPDGPGFSAKQVAALASEYRIKDNSDAGEPIERAGRPADRFPAPFANDAAARTANGGVAPPDMSTLAKARGISPGFPWFVLDMVTQYQEHGPDYIAALLTGYGDAPADVGVAPRGHYNAHFPGHVIAMPPPLRDGQVGYDDDAPQTLDQYAKDVAAFLMWAAEPHLVARKRIGFQVMAFLILLTGLLYVTKKKVWSALETPHPR